MQSFFTGLGTTLANFTPAILVSLGILALSDKMDNGIPVSTYWALVSVPLRRLRPSWLPC